MSRARSAAAVLILALGLAAGWAFASAVGDEPAARSLADLGAAEVAANEVRVIVSDYMLADAGSAARRALRAQIAAQHRVVDAALDRVRPTLASGAERTLLRSIEQGLGTYRTAIATVLARADFGDLAAAQRYREAVAIPAFSDQVAPSFARLLDAEAAAVTAPSRSR